MGFFETLRNGYRVLVGQPVFSGAGGQWFNNPNFVEADPYQYFSNYPGTDLDYKRLVGEPTKQSLVMSPVNWLGQQLTEAPLRVYKTGKNGKPEIVPSHPLSKLMKRPTPFFTGQLLYKAWALGWIIDGNAYWLKVRNANGQVIQLWPLPHHAVSPLYPEDGSEYISAYMYRTEGRDYVLPIENVVHFRAGFDPKNTRKGLSPLDSLYRELYSDNERANFSAAMMRNFGIPGLVISPASEMQIIDDDGRRKIKEAYQRNFGADGRGSPLVASTGLKVEKVSFDPQEMELSAITKLPEERVAAVLGIPAAVLGYGAGLASVNYAIMKELREQAYEGVVIPTQKLMADEITAQLLIDYEDVDFGEDDLRCGFDLSEVRVLQEDETKRAERISKIWTAGIITRAEARAALGEPVDEDRDSVFLASAGTALVPEDKANGASGEPIVAIYDQQRDATNQGSQVIERPDPAKPRTKLHAIKSLNEE